MGRIDPVERWLRALWIWIVGAADDKGDAGAPPRHDR
jgi:hypothetical protein